MQRESRQSTILMFLAALFMVSQFVAGAFGGVAYDTPAGGWVYILEGNDAEPGAGRSDFDALDGTWNHDNGSDSWDGSGPGTDVGWGGLGAFVEPDGTTYLRIQDTGDPRDHGWSDPSNRKIMLGHNITTEGASDTILDDGVTLSFRARLSTGDNLDLTAPNGGGDRGPWPAMGRGNVITNTGKGMFGIRQKTIGLISFSLSTEENTASLSGTSYEPFNGLLFNAINFNTTVASEDVDLNDVVDVENVELNHIPMTAQEVTQWQEFWITIQGQDDSDPNADGTHAISIYRNGSLEAADFVATAGGDPDDPQEGGERAYQDSSYLLMGLPSTNDYGAFDVDFFAWAPGIHAPAPSIVNRCDLNGDGKVDAADAGILFSVWNTDGGVTDADKNGDNIVDAADAGELFAAWTGDAPAAGPGQATASYNAVSGLIEISADGVVNAFIESASNALTPGAADTAPAGVLVSDNASRVGLTGFGGISVTNWKSHNTPGLGVGDLSLVVGPALGVPSVSHAAGSAGFIYVPEPASYLLLCGMVVIFARRVRTA